MLSRGHLLISKYSNTERFPVKRLCFLLDVLLELSLSKIGLKHGVIIKSQ